MHGEIRGGRIEDLVSSPRSPELTWGRWTGELGVVAAIGF